MKVVIDVQDLGKLYRLGEVGTGTLSHDLKRWWASVRGREDPFSRVGQVNDRTREGIQGEYVWALKDVSFQIQQGDVVGIVGRNGAGKSTLLKILSRITSPSAGAVKIRGRIGSLLEVGTGFHQEMTGRENIFMNGTVLGMRRYEITRKLDEIVDFAGVARYLDTPVKRYSSGMMVRLGFAVAAFLEPEILIVDEVLAVGDAEFQRKAIGKMQDVSRGEGRTVIFVSHNMTSVRKLCDRGIFMRNGTIERVGSSEEIIDLYLSENQKPTYSNNSLGGVHLKTLVFREGNGCETKSLKALQPFSVELIFESFDVFSEVSVALGFNNMNGVRVLSLWTKFTGQLLEVVEGKFKVIFEVPQLRLTPGEYSITTYIESKGNELERIDEVSTLIVSFAGDSFYKFEPKLSQGLYMEKFTFRVDTI